MEIIYLPEAMGSDDIRRKGVHFERRVASTTIIMEELGLLVFNRTIPIEFVNEMMGGTLRSVWKRLRPWLEAERTRLGLPAMGEWFQWLVERIEENPGLAKVPAHLRYASWKP